MTIVTLGVLGRIRAVTNAVPEGSECSSFRGSAADDVDADAEGVAVVLLECGRPFVLTAVERAPAQHRHAARRRPPTTPGSASTRDRICSYLPARAPPDPFEYPSAVEVERDDQGVVHVYPRSTV